MQKDCEDDLFWSRCAIEDLQNENLILKNNICNKIIKIKGFIIKSFLIGQYLLFDYDKKNIRICKDIIVKVIRNRNFSTAFHELFIQIVENKRNNKKNNQNEKNLYSNWILINNKYNIDKKDEITKYITKYKHYYVISIILPVYRPKLKNFIKTIMSIENQLYPNWELCIVNDYSQDSRIDKYVTKKLRYDKRIKYYSHTTNEGISKASNRALKMATGDYVALIDHDDIIPTDALLHYYLAININPNLMLIYSDEDKIDLEENNVDPYFKSDWNKTLFYSHNCINHLTLYRRSIVEKVGGFRSEFDGAQDWDLALRVIENIHEKQIYHIPRILYHWRISPGSTASDIYYKKYAIDAGINALKDHFKRTNIQARVTMGPWPGSLRFNYIPKINEEIAIIIPTKNHAKLLKQCVQSIIEKTTYKNYCIYIIDNNSNDKKTLEYLENGERKKYFKVLKNNTEPFNFSKINNDAVKQINSEYILFLNNDTKVIDGIWLEEMYSFASKDGIGAVGAKLLYPDNTIQHGGVIIGMGNIAGHAHWHCADSDPGYNGRAKLAQNISAVTGACMLTKKSIFNKVGGFDDQKFKIAFNDVDYCLKIRTQGYTIVWTPYARLYHYESKSRGYEKTYEQRLRFLSEMKELQKKWHTDQIEDPYYNPNLSLENGNFSIANPPRITFTLKELEEHYFTEEI